MNDQIPETMTLPSKPKYGLDSARMAVVRTAPPVVMDLKEASAYLVCSPRKMRDLIASGRVKSARIGAKIVIRRQWLDAFLGV
jgi:excisionase family DNA binding protein